MPRSAFDTNILAYAQHLAARDTDIPKIASATALLHETVVSGEPLIVPVQTLGELHRVMVNKFGIRREEAAERIHQIAANAVVVPTTHDLLADALQLAAQHKLQTFDSIILAAAAEARCDVLYSEDFQPGFSWRGVEVVNPFA